MSTIVKTIHDNLKSYVNTTLGSSWRELRNPLDPSKEDSRNVDRAYGVRHGPADFAESVLKYYTNDHLFEVALTRKVVNRDNDDETQRIFNDLYDVADDLAVGLLGGKINAASTVLSVSLQSLSQPEVLDNDAALLIFGFTVKYRKQIT